MKTYLARVRNGRVVVDGSRKLPEGARVKLIVESEKPARRAATRKARPKRAAEVIETLDDMSPAEKKALEKRLALADKEYRAGRWISAEECIAEFEAKRRRK